MGRAYWMAAFWLTTAAMLQCACGTAGTSTPSATAAPQASPQDSDSPAPADAWGQPPAPEAMAAQAIDGRWLSDMGDLHISRDVQHQHGRVTGAWTSGGGPTGARGSFEGRLQGNVLSLSWREQRESQTASGRGYVVFTTDGQAFYGRWWTAANGTRGEWTGWRRRRAASGASEPISSATDPLGRGAGPAKRGSLGAGTCFAVSPDGLVVTAAHVIERARTIRIRFPVGGSRHIATIVAKDTDTDLALLRVTRRGQPFLPLAKSWPRLGEKVFTIGFPYSFDLGAEPKFSEGVLSSRSVAGVKGLMQVSMPIQPGNSGGPLVDHRGEVVGVVFARADDMKFLERTGSLPQNVAFAVAAGFLRPMLRTPRRLAPATSREAAIDRAESAICSVLVEH